jgi:alpha-glucosidase
MLTPTLENLPVYVRGGAIIPIQPPVQSTNEKPQGPLTLRVFAPSTNTVISTGGSAAAAAERPASQPQIPGAPSSARGDASQRETNVGSQNASGATNPTCHGTLYLDDGISFAFRNGAYLRMESTCELTPEGLRIHIGRHDGTFQPWWHDLRIEVYGYNSRTALATANNQPVPASSTETTPLTINLPDPGTGIDLLLK